MDETGGEQLRLHEVTIPVEIPVRPVSRREIKQLEAALIIGTLFRHDVMRSALSKEEFLTWVDSLAVAASALAMEKAGYTVSQMAEELGRTEATIRRHLKGETRAGQLVKETYEMLLKGELRLALPVLGSEEVSRLSERARELENELERLQRENSELREKMKSLEEKLKKVLEKLGSIENSVKEARSLLTS